MSSYEEQSNVNVACWHLKTLKAISERGRWPDELSAKERIILRRSGIVKLEYTHNHTGRQPKLTPWALNFLTTMIYRG